jgi:hypothetical protein
MEDEPDTAQQEARDEIARLYLERHDNIVSDELSNELLVDLLLDPETKPLVLRAYPEIADRLEGEAKT